MRFVCGKKLALYAKMQHATTPIFWFPLGDD
jgi:hypothetical protein